MERTLKRPADFFVNRYHAETTWLCEAKQMKLTKIYLITILLLICGVSASGQEPPKAVLVDEFGQVSCSDLRGRVDAFLSELAKQTNWVGFVVTGHNADNKISSIFREELIRAQVDIRNFD